MRYLVGAGGLAKEFLSYASYNGDKKIVGVIDKEDGLFYGLPVIAEEKVLADKDRGMDGLILATGQIELRKSLIEKFDRYYFPNIYFGGQPSHMASVGRGFVMCPFSLVTSNARIGNFCLLNVYSCVAHDCIIGNNCVLSPSVQLNGNVTVGDNVFFGTGAIVIPGISICSDVVIGAGCVVTKSILMSGVYVGNPAREL